ncbi:hypothetical protein [Amycolatopsis sp. NPDC051128]|uniref:hypothetical protein n=1 Tax=Amycolatopsis sp. NPDC051128 TaxID=3155412 RepID=UPI00343672F9
MPLLNGPKVRHLAAALGWDLPTLATKAKIPVRAVQNCTRERRPQPMHLTRIYALGRTLAEETGEDYRAVTAEIVDESTVAAEILANATGAGSQPDKEQPKREPTGPARRQEKTTGPKRPAEDVAA